MEDIGSSGILFPWHFPCWVLHKVNQGRHSEGSIIIFVEVSIMIMLEHKGSSAAAAAAARTIHFHFLAQLSSLPAKKKQQDKGYRNKSEIMLRRPKGADEGRGTLS